MVRKRKLAGLALWRLQKVYHKERPLRIYTVWSPITVAALELTELRGFLHPLHLHFCLPKGKRLARYLLSV